MVLRSSSSPSRGHDPPRTRAWWRSPVCEPPRSANSATVNLMASANSASSTSSSEPASRAGSRPVRHRISSTSRLPRPGYPVLVQQPGLSVQSGFLPEQAAICSTANPKASGPSRLSSGSSSTPPQAAEGSTTTRVPSSSKPRLKPAPLGKDPGAGILQLLDRGVAVHYQSARSCRTEGPALRWPGRREWPKSIIRSLPVRRTPTTVWPSKAKVNAVASAPPLMNQSSGACTADTVRPTTASAARR